MSDRTAIPWTDATWSPISGCSKVSAGCANCYISRTPPFRKAHRRFERVGNSMTTGVILHPDRLDQPLHWRKPRRIFVCSMSDLFHENVDSRFIAEVFTIMASAPNHTFQVLTKRPERMLEVLERPGFKEHVWGASWSSTGKELEDMWPLPNVWLGVSAENQYWADRRIPLLLQTPAAVRFLSLEPLLKAVDLRNIVVYKPTHPNDPTATLDALTGYVAGPDDMGPKIDWTIIGGESGPRHRPMDPAWVEDIAGQCAAAGVPVFVKQDSGPRPGQQGRLSNELWALKGFPVAAPG